MPDQRHKMAGAQIFFEKAGCPLTDNPLKNLLPKRTYRHDQPSSRHQLLFDIAKYNRQLEELHKLFGKIAISKKDLSYENQQENRNILDILQKKKMTVFDINAFDEKRSDRANPFYSLPLTYIPVTAKNCSFQAQWNCGTPSDANGGVPFLSLQGIPGWHIRKALYQSFLIVPKNGGIGTAYRLQGYKHAQEKLANIRTLRFYAGIGEGLTGKIVTSPDFHVLIGVAGTKCDSDDPRNPFRQGEAGAAALGPVFTLYHHIRENFFNLEEPGEQIMGANRTPGIVFYQKLDMSPEEVERYVKVARSQIFPAVDQLAALLSTAKF